MNTGGIAQTLTIGAGLVLTGMMGRAQSAAQDTRESRSSGMISVAALRTPAKARQHFENARAAAIAGHEAEYERELAAALAIDPQFGEAYLLRAVRKVEARRYEDAIADALTAERFDPGKPWPTIVHAEACNGLHRYDEAAALLDGLSSTGLGTWQAKYEMARASIGRGDAEASLQWTKLTLEAIPAARRENAVLLRANALQLAQRWREAVEQFDVFLGLNGADSPMHEQVAAIRERVRLRAVATENASIAAR